MGAPIRVAAFERSGSGSATRRRAQAAAVAAPAGVVLPADRAQTPGTPASVTVSTPSAPTREDPAISKLPSEYLRASVRKPMSPYEVKAGTIIPAVMLTAINSDLPGQITGQVRENVYDSDTGEHLLIPQGTRLVGFYDHHVVYGQQRVLITWKRLILPDGSSLSLTDGPARNRRGRGRRVSRSDEQPLPPGVWQRAAPLGDWRRRPAEPDPGVRPELPGAHRRERPRGRRRPAVRIDGVGVHLPRLSLAPTLDVRPGFPFNVMVTQDVIFPGPYQKATS